MPCSICGGTTSRDYQICYTCKRIKDKHDNLEHCQYLNQLSFDSLIKKYEPTYHWGPQLIDNYRNTLKITHAREEYSIKSNIAYTLQYLEYIQKQLNELILTSVLYKMLYKNFVIASMGIIESLFKDLLKRTDQYKEKINLKRTIEKVQEKELIKFSNPNIFEIIEKCRKLRNKVHIQDNDIDNKTDYFEFKDKSQKEIKQVLFEILTHTEFCSSETNAQELYNFLIEKETQKLHQNK